MSFSNRTIISVLVTALLLPTVAAVGINLYLDPFEIFSVGNQYPGVLLGGRGRDRYQHAGTLRQHAPESVIVGNSYAANFTPSTIDSSLGWSNTYSITMDGGTLYEQRKVLGLGFDVAPIENVLWAIDASTLVAPHFQTYQKIPFPDFLYNSWHLDDIRLYTVLPREIKKYTSMRAEKFAALEQESALGGIHIDPRDRSTEWMSEHHTKFGNPAYVLGKIFRGRADQRQTTALFLQTKALGPIAIASGKLSNTMGENFRENLKYNIVPLIEQNPDTKFYLIAHLPFPLLYWQYLKATAPAAYLGKLLTIRNFVQALSHEPNVEIYGFGAERYTAELDLYKDATHFHADLNRAMVVSISLGNNRLTSRNVVSYLQDFDRVVTGYRLSSTVWDRVPPSSR